MLSGIGEVKAAIKESNSLLTVSITPLFYEWNVLYADEASELSCFNYRPDFSPGELRKEFHTFAVCSSIFKDFLSSGYYGSLSKH